MAIFTDDFSGDLLRATSVSGIQTVLTNASGAVITDSAGNVLFVRVRLILPTPDSRVVLVPYEPRVAVTLAENRAAVTRAEIRIAATLAENRTVTPPAEARVITLLARGQTISPRN